MNLDAIGLTIPLMAGIITSVITIIWLLVKKYLGWYKIGIILFSGCLIWMVFYTLELLSKDLAFKITMSKIEYIGIVAVPITFFILSLYFSGYTQWINFKKNFFLLIIPVLTLLLVFTNGLHNLIWKDLFLTYNGKFIFLDFKYGIGFWIYAGSSYLLIFVSYIILVRGIIGKIKIFKLQSISMIVALTMSIVANIVYVMDILPLKDYDITPLAITLSCIVLIYGFNFLKIGDIIPIRSEPKIDNEKDIALTIDNNGRLLFINSLGQKLLNIKDKNFTGKKLSDILPAYSIFLQDSYENLENDRNIIVDYDSRNLIFDININPVIEKRTVKGKTFILRDVTEQKNAEKALKESEEKFRSIFENSLDGIYSSTLEGKYLEVNDALVKMLGYDNKEELLSKDIKRDIYFSEKDRPPSSYRNRIFEARLKRKDGRKVWTEINSRVIFNNNIPFHYEGIVRNIDERKKSENRIKYLSYHDFLTGLYNRYFFEEELKRLDSHRLYPISIIIADINGFKLVNDTFGHKRGDEILKNTGGILKACFRKEDIIARWGGDEFIILLPSTSGMVASQITKRIISLFNKKFYEEFITSISIGIATKETGNENLYELIKVAESNMYRHKLMEKQSLHSSIIISLEKALEERNYETKEHVLRTKKLAVKFGAELNFTENQLDELSLLSTLHDIGKIAITDNIILKPSKLSKDEYEIMKRHTEVGFRIANSTQELVPIANGILSHHERWDGEGYPLGLKGEEIPLIARVMAIIDSYDAIINDRPYRKAHSKQYAINELLECAGKQFDPALVGKFIEIISGKEIEKILVGNKDIHISTAK